MSQRVKFGLFGVLVAAGLGVGAAMAAPAAHRVQYDQSRWHPIGCVESPHECEDLAHSQDHPYHRVVQDVRACHHHPHLLCLGAG